MAKQPKDKEKKMRKTTIRLPENLWLESRIYGLREGVELQDMVAEGLKLYLKQPKGKKSGKGGK